MPEIGRGGGLRLRLRLLRCLPERLTAATHRRAESLRPSPSVLVRGLRCGEEVWGSVWASEGRELGEGVEG